MTDLASGDDRTATFERSVMPEAGRLFALALAIVDDPGEAEDVVQETMLSAWRRWSALQSYTNQAAWLTRVCVNHCIRRRRFLLRRVLWSQERWSGTPQPEPPAAEAWFADIHRAYQSLSPPQRAMVTLHFHDGFTVNECAAIIGCRPGTARSHLGRAIAKLRKEFARG